jgi:hypothetical protein
LVEVAVEGDLVAHDADLAVEGVGLVGIDPGIWDVREDFLFDVGFVERVDGLAGIEGDVLVVPEVAIGDCIR